MTRPLAPERAELPAGTAFGDYRIRRLLGRGGMAEVYEAEHVPDGRVVALKVLGAQLVQPDARGRFLREGRCAAAINHPNTVYVYGTEEIDGVPAISMELVADGTLEDRVRAQGPLSSDETIECAAQLVDGLAAAHDVGLLHRDVKPSNCFVAADGTYKIGDFGLSKPIEADEQQRLTRSGTFLGTPVFSSPEQLLGETLDVRSDVYALGLTLYYALTGQLPYPSGTMAQVVAAVLNGAPTPLTAHRPDLPPAVAALVMKAMARHPADRFQDYDELRAAVARLRLTVVPAPLALRLGAWLVDATLVMAVALGVAAALGWLDQAEPSTPSLRTSLAVLGVAIALVALPEGRQGASPGKWLLGVRVAGAGGRAPGLARACARVAVLWSCYPLTDLALWLSGDAAVGVGTTLLGRLAVVGTARPSNGWLTVYDRLTGTRVVRSMAEPLRRRRANTRAAAPAGAATGPGIGPYVLVPDGHACDGCRLAWDPVLHRHVWVVERRASEPPIPNVRRDVARATRLRWVGSGRSGETRWDAYDAPGGESFLRRLERPVEWEVLQAWIADLGDELAAAERDGTLPAVPAVEALWVGENDGLLIADAVQRSTTGATERAPRDLVAEMIARVRESGRLPMPLPPFAARALDAAASAAHPQAARAAIEPAAGRPVALSRQRRIWLLAATLAPVAPLVLLVVASSWFAFSVDRDGWKLKALLAYVAADGAAGAAGARGDTRGRDTTASTSEEMGRAIGEQAHGWTRRIGLVAEHRAPRRPPSAAEEASAREYAAYKRRLAAVYVATVLADRARDTSIHSGRLSEAERAHALRLVAEYGAADTAEVRRARVLVDQVWQGEPNGESTSEMLWFSALLVLVFSGTVAVAGALVAAVLARRGVLLRAFDLELVTADGRAASRPRVVARQLAAGPPALAAITLCFLVLADTLMSGSEVTMVGRVVLAGVALAWAAWLWITVRTPARSPADRLAGTYLVPA